MNPRYTPEQRPARMAEAMACLLRAQAALVCDDVDTAGRQTVILLNILRALRRRHNEGELT
jgi:hypothetical protein